MRIQPVIAIVALSAGMAATRPALAGPNGAPRNLTIWVVQEDVRLSWLAPEPGSGNTQVRILRRLNAPPTGPGDPAASVLYAGPATQFVDPMAGLLPDVAGTPRTYYYAAFGCDGTGANCETTGSHAALAPSLVQCLRGGGYTLFWRHADADVCSDNLSLGTAANPVVPDWWRNCDANCATATARQLNAAGVQHATVIGQQIRSLGIGIGRVLTSEFCRCIQTAEYMAFGPGIETDPGITYFVYDEANRCTHCYERLQETPSPGTNTAIIGHAGFSPVCPTLGALQWSECAVFKPDGAGGAAFIAQLPWNAWGGLAADVAAQTPVPAGTAVHSVAETAAGVRIRYRVETRTAVPIRLEAFDIRGRRLWSAPLATKPRGEYEELWDRHDLQGRTVGRGIYLVRLQAGAATAARKAVLLQ